MMDVAVQSREFLNHDLQSDKILEGGGSSKGPRAPESRVPRPVSVERAIELNFSLPSAPHAGTSQS